MATVWAVVTTEVAGLHCWPDAGMHAPYLSNKHRHVFKVVVWIEQAHDDREIEYIWFKDVLDSYYRRKLGDQSIIDFGHRSCEMLARELVNALRTMEPAWERRSIKVQVMEDGENGALLESPASS